MGYSFIQYMGSRIYETSNGEGWGLTYDGEHLVASDGTNMLTFFEVPNMSHKSTRGELKKARSIINPM